MKKLNISFIFFYIFFYSFSISAQSNIQDYLKIEKNRLHKADSIESNVKKFISKKINSFQLSSESITEITKNLLNEHDGTDKSINGNNKKEVFLQIKKDKLRELYFQNNNQVLQYFRATTVPNTLAINCINGGFETGNTANYTFKSIFASASPIQHLVDGCTVNNYNGDFSPSINFNQYQDRATLVTSGNEPFLSGIGININKVHNGNYSLKINPNPIDAPTLQIGNVTSVFRDFQIDGTTIDFSYLHFGYVVPNLTHLQPYFRYRVYRLNSFGNTTDILREVCIPMDFVNCKYLQVPDNRLGFNTLSYTPNWVCQQINTSDLIGQNVRLEFTVSDCEFRGHFSTVYVDDLCGTSCPPTWGVIHLNDVNINCPTVPFDVCGNFQLPDQSTLGSIQLNILNQSNTIIGTITNSIINGQNFCFTVNPTIFGANPIGNYSFQVVANLNNSQCVPFLTDSLGSVNFSTLITPTFNQVAPICSGDNMQNLPSTSNNGIIGTWSPSINNTTTTNYTFTPNFGFCANLATMTIVINPRIVPVFEEIDPICFGDAIDPLPLVSDNGISGTWSPNMNNLATTTYTFTPDNGECATSKQMTIIVYPKKTPLFNSIRPICYEDFNFSLPLVSDNNISGSWSPNLDYTHSAQYIFTPNIGECANSASFELQVNPDIDYEYLGYCDEKSFKIKIVPLNNSFNTDNVLYNWQFNNLTINADSIFDVSLFLNSTPIIEKLPLVFTIEITNANGCKKLKTIIVDSVYCEIQKGISPNYDGLNDFFDLRLLSVKKLSIFNRYGMKVYSKENYKKEWQGQTDSGTILPDATYYYMIEFENGVTKTGWIYLNKEKN